MIEEIKNCPLSLTILLPGLTTWVTRRLPYQKQEPLLTIRVKMDHPRVFFLLWGGCSLFLYKYFFFFMWFALLICLYFRIVFYFFFIFFLVCLFVFVLPCLVLNVDCVAGLSIPDCVPSVFSNVYFPNTLIVHKNITTHNLWL